jgi:indole-3-glycerol phosphate synthase
MPAGGRRGDPVRTGDEKSAATEGICVNILDTIIEVKKEEVKKLRATHRLRHFQDSEFFERPVRALSDALKAGAYPSVIAEIKKASPSAGVIRADFDPVRIAHLYQDSGADAISVLTDKRFFQGDIAYLSTIAGFSYVPLLRKDFIIDVYQVFQSRWAGADAVLLIAEVLSGSQIAELTHAAAEAGLEVLLELHDAARLSMIDTRKNRIIGINNRNLEDFSVDLATSVMVKAQLPPDTLTVAESGIKTSADVQKIKNAGINGILVGEHLMRAAETAGALRELIGWCRDAG